MSISNFAAQVAPMDHVAKVVQQEQDSGMMKQMVLQHVLSEKLAKDGQQVERTSASESGQKIKRQDERGRKGSGGGHDGRRENADAAAMTGLEEQLAELGIDSETGSNVWAGNIVNVKV